MKEISEKELRKIRHLLFEAMDKKIIEYSSDTDVKDIQERSIIKDILKYIGLEPQSKLAQQLRAEYKTWKQTLNNGVKQLREHENTKEL